MENDGSCQYDLASASEEAARLFVEIFEKLETRKADPGVDFDSLLEVFRETLKSEGVGLLAALRDFREKVVPNCLAIPHPLYLGLVNSSPLPGAALADHLISALNNNDGGVPQAALACEQEVIRAFRELYELSASWNGLILPGGAFTTLQGLLLARASAFPEIEDEGFHSLRGIPRIYASEATHFTVARAAKEIGVGERNVVCVPCLGRGSIDEKGLEEQIRADRRSGHLPFAVVATIGTTGTGAVDPIRPIGDICRREKLWLHVDACYGGAARLVPELRSLFEGIEAADSISIDAHKWFFVAISAGLLLTRHRDLECRIFGLSSGSYIPSDRVIHPLWRGIACSRRASGLGIWMALRAHGWNTVRRAVERNIHLIRELEKGLARNGFEVLPGGQLSVACARWEGTDELQGRIATEIVASGDAWFATVRFGGRTWLRFNLLNLYTKQAHIHLLIERVSETARRLTGQSFDNRV
jgi:glutamate/tyrosine decarboxylase-like PLP-dependent enzyme